MSEDSRKKKALIVDQFGRAAADYATSQIHARGESLSLLVEYAEPERDWRVLDVGCGAGHTALAFAPHVREVVATDLTPQMVEKAQQLASAAQADNVSTQTADAESLPFEDDSFDLVSCRLAAHHFVDAERAISEFARVLRPSGRLAYSDNVTVDSQAAADYYNEFERIRDPSHQCVLGRQALAELLEGCGLRIDRSTVVTKELEFHEWADRQRTEAADKERLLDLMRTVPAELVPLFRPRWDDGTLYFHLWEIVLTASHAER